MKKNISIFILLIFCNVSISQEVVLYKNPDITIDKRVDDLISRMTLKEKFWQLFMLPFDLNDSLSNYRDGAFGFQFSTTGKTENGAEQLLNYASESSALQMAQTINRIQKYFVEQTRLGIPIIPFDEALHGLVRDGATAFPQAIALAASWDTLLMGDVAKAIASEVKSRGIRQVLSPVVNIASDVRWGRTEETYGEDPFLVSEMALSFVKEFEKMGVITTPKHFVANVGDGGRDSYPIHINERLLEEIYFSPFKTCVQNGNSSSLMTAYNSYDGTPCTSNTWLLNQKLKEEWGFKGFVISDAGATGGANVLHNTSLGYAESTKQAIESGLDVIFQTSYSHYKLFFEAFEKGMISQESIDNAVRRVLYAKFKLGLFENPYVDTGSFAKVDFVNQYKAIARKAAQESIVLLKNNNRTLPFSKQVKSVAVIGSDAADGRLGGYSRNGKANVNILDGIRSKIGDSKVKFVEGCGRIINDFLVVPSEYLYCYSNGKKVQGFLGEYFNNISLQGNPVLTRIDNQINFSWTLFSAAPSIVNADFYSVRWTGFLVAPESGTFSIGLNGDDGYKLYINDSLIIDDWKKQTVRTSTSLYNFEKGKEYKIRVEFYESVGNARIQMVWSAGVDYGWKSKIEDAVELVRKSDVAIVVVGIEEGEFRDRAYLSLPAHQEDLINEVAKVGKPMVVVLVGGSAITMTNFIDNVPAILDVWYSGDEGGNAIADVIFGDYNPAGRLPITFPVDESQLPLVYNHKPTGRGDDYLNLTGKPLFPFGFGLSYSEFTYSGIQFSSLKIGKQDTLTVSFNLKNDGLFDGDEVVQLYIKDLYSSVAQPVMQLKGFQRIHLRSNQSQIVTFTIIPSMLAMLNKELKWMVEPGEFKIMIGASSNDIRLMGKLVVE